MATPILAWLGTPLYGTTITPASVPIPPDTIAAKAPIQNLSMVCDNDKKAKVYEDRKHVSGPTHQTFGT